MRRLSVLLIDERRQGLSGLVGRLKQLECACEFATSLEEACDQLSRQGCDLVLSRLRVRDQSLYPLIRLLEGSSITLFYSQPVEDGCWWLPALWRGRDCFGSAALRGSEFIGQIGELIEDLLLEAIAPAPPKRGQYEDEGSDVSSDTVSA